MSFEPMVKYKFYRLNVIFSFTPIFYNMYMNGSVVVRIEHKNLKPNIINNVGIIQI